ncbi:MAG: MBL fold metallo-hydrolase [Actinomycetota bacterium]
MSPLAGLPVADPWFATERVGDDITRIDEPHVHPLLRCNVWHVAGRDRDLVVDTALGLASLRSVVEEVTDRPLLAVATHAHSDHVGGMHEFDERAIHPAEAEAIAEGGLASVEVAHFPEESVLGPYRAAGDAIYDGPLLDELETSDLDDYLRTIRRLRGLPVTVVHGGHEPSFGRARLVELCDAFLALRG